MTKRWTDADVERLVECVRDMDTYFIQAKDTAAPGASGEHPLWGYVHDALAPFQPDPEEELIEKMAKAWQNVMDPYTETELGTVSLRAMRAALEVVKQEGWGPK